MRGEKILRVGSLGVMVALLAMWAWQQWYPSQSVQLAPRADSTPQALADPSPWAAASAEPSEPAQPEHSQWPAAIGELPHFPGETPISVAQISNPPEETSSDRSPSGPESPQPIPSPPQPPSDADSSRPSESAPLLAASLPLVAAQTTSEEFSPPSAPEHPPTEEISPFPSGKSSPLRQPSGPPQDNLQATLPPPEAPLVAMSRPRSPSEENPQDLSVPMTQPGEASSSPDPPVPPTPRMPNLSGTLLPAELSPSPKKPELFPPADSAQMHPKGWPPGSFTSLEKTEPSECLGQPEAYSLESAETERESREHKFTSSRKPSLLAEMDFPKLDFSIPEQIPHLHPLHPPNPSITKQGFASEPACSCLPKGPECPSEKCSAPEEAYLDLPHGNPSWIYHQAVQAHKLLFYDNQFDYLEDPSLGETYLGDCLKRVRFTPWTTLDLGGQYRLRHHSERNHRGAGLTGLDDDFLLHRTRIYANLELGELARIYAEMNDALSTNETCLPQPMEEDRTELENLFIDVPLLGVRSEGLLVRLGRQELLYGAGRLLSPLDWANTRRTFEGYKLFWQGELWRVDAFWGRPVYPNPAAFDGPDQSQQFLGLYLRRRLGEQAAVEAYYFRLVEEDGSPDFDFHTLGLRGHQEYHGWLGELEAAVQFGTYGAIHHIAGMYTVGLGRRFSCLPGQPVFWTYYDWASGDPTQGNGFHHLLPDSHQYLGYMDLFGRRNIEDWSFHLLVQPAEAWRLRLAWHIFHRQHPLDVPYGVDMRPVVAAPGGSGDYGQELDVVVQWTIRPRAELQFGYSRFFAGQFFRTNPSPAPYQDDADFFYTEFTLRF